MSATNRIRPVMLVIMDGWGWREETDGNAVRLANTPNLDSYYKTYPFTLLKASGEAVGLPPGQMGNSEVGHLNLGAGRIVYQELTRINMAIEDGSFFENPTLKDIMSKVKASPGARLHLMGLVSDGGVHSQMEHLFALIEMAARYEIGDRLCIHAFMDGRDTPPTSGASYIARLQEHMKGVGAGVIASICGRFYAMDRDTRWDRVEVAYEMLVRGKGRVETDPVEAVKKAYERGETDEFIKPILIQNDCCPFSTGKGPIKDGDAIFHFNFRADRARELTRAFTEEGFSFFDVSDRPKLLAYATMTMYDKHFDLPVAFPPEKLKHILGEEISLAGLKQLRIAETEKYAHVTYFFNGGEETPFENEDRILIPSPREVPTYDLKPEMSAREIADKLVENIEKNIYSLIVVNFANGDMVGHTGVLEAAIKACEVVDECVGKVTEAFRKTTDGAVIITADHGNAEVMKLPDGSPATAHTTNPVPLYLVDDRHRGVKLTEGILGDVAPTVLKLMSLEQPKEMTGKPLF
ncbi:MAG: 2,3-bisphosphoglycerate-independent phosphoglycerate mutase [Thermodesulfobacteria bacterium]|nr:2,3-bisphosphoglycerate-independent phosphoglycerate mutase [Thermodesulfobacteriota bacterium]